MVKFVTRFKSSVHILKSLSGHFPKGMYVVSSTLKHAQEVKISKLKNNTNENSLSHCLWNRFGRDVRFVPKKAIERR